MRKPIAIPFTFLLALTACGGSQVGAQTIGPSAGVETVRVERSAADFPVVGTVGAEPELDLNLMDPEDPLSFFGAVSAIRTFPDGGFLVADGASSRIGFFDREGRLQRRVGGQGESPGQFRTLSSVPLATADSVWAWDEMASRLTIFPRAEGGPPLVRSVIGGANSRYAEVHVLPDRGVLAVARARTIGASFDMTVHIPQRDSIRFTRFDPVGRPMGTVLTIPGEEWLQMQFGAQDNFVMTVTAQLPLGRDGAYAVLPDGVIGGANDRFELNRWEVDGRLRRINEFPGLSVPLDPEQVAALRDQWVEAAGGVPERVEHIDAVFSPYLIPENRPAFGRILSGTEGRVWIEEYDPWSPERPRWWLFDDRAGTLLGYVDFPPGFEVYEIGSDAVYGVYRDETGLSHVRRHPLQLRVP